MLVVHGTAAFRDRVPGTPPGDGEASTSALGGWYAGIVRRRSPLALFVDERTWISVLMRLAPARTLLARLPDAVGEVLRELGVPEDFIAAELAAMREVRLAPTASRTATGVLTNKIGLLDHFLTEEEEDLLPLSLRLIDQPTGRDLVFPEQELRRIAGMPPRRRVPSVLTQDPDGFPTAVQVDGRTIEIQRQRGLAASLIEEMKPLLLAEGIDLDDPDRPPDRAHLEAALNRASERRDLALFTPVGVRRDATLPLLRDAAEALGEGRDDDVAPALATARPEALSPAVPEVSAVIGVALGLLDGWLTRDAPAGLAGLVRVPRAWRRAARPATDVVALAARGRAFDSIGALIARNGGEQVLAGAVVALGATAAAWAGRTGEPLPQLLHRILR